MKYALTGHTQGIGKEIFMRLGPKNCKGFSLSTGYNIQNSDDRKLICQAVKECNIFINNAHAGWSQTELLIDILDCWHDKDKQIINIGSRAAHIEIPPERRELLIYAAQKSALLNTVMNSQNFKCTVDYLSWGYVGTERILQKYPNLKEYISINQAVDEVFSLIHK